MSGTLNLQLSTQQLTIGYGREVLLSNINFNLLCCEAVLIKGPNGSGKTTFLKTLLGLIKPISGSITFFDAFGQPVPRPVIGYLPQLSQLDKYFPIRVSEVIESGLPLDLARAIRRERVEQAANLLGTVNLLSRPIVELSGGQLQRTLLARAIVSEPDLLILDEPNAYLDAESRTVFYEALQQLSHRSSILMVSHESPPNNSIQWRKGHL